jgi:hypothetical protein
VSELERGHPARECFVQQLARSACKSEADLVDELGGSSGF